MEGAVKVISGRLNPLKLFLVPRELTSMLIAFSKEEGIIGVMKGMKAFTHSALMSRLSTDLGYKLDLPVKGRMISTLCEFLIECGYLSRAGEDSYSYSGGQSSSALTEAELTLGSEEKAILERHFNGQMLFFSTCLSEAGGFLRGKDSPFTFTKRWESLWDGFLGNYEFQTLRTILLRLMDLKNDKSFKVLDLCYGLGHGVEGILEYAPEVSITALDFSGAYKKAVVDRVRRSASSSSLELLDGAWKGFGDPLPLSDSSVDAVHFTCADPYIPEALREGVYRDIHRVLKKGGTLGVLAWSYPDKMKTVVTNRWVRRQILAHDFIESVCAGWHGFYGIDETAGMFERIGFVHKQGLVPLDSNLSSALWVMVKQ